MKKIICLLFIIASIMCIDINQKSFLQVIKLPNNSTYSVFVGKDYIPCIDGISSIKNGSVNILSCTSSLAKDLKKSIDEDILGESLSFNGDKKDFLNYLNSIDMKIVYVENFDNIYSIYGYCKNLKNTLYLSYGKVNLQLSFSNGTITVGNPVIIGSY